MEETINKDNLEKFYDDISSIGKGRDLTLSSIFSIFNEDRLWRFIHFALYQLGYINLPNLKFLDAGCGDGRAINRLVELGVPAQNCYGVDGSESVIDYAKNKNSISKFDCSMLSSLNYEDNYFDFSLCLGVLNHIRSDEDVVTTLNEVRRVMKPGGHIVITLPGKHVRYSESTSKTLRVFNIEEGEFQESISSMFKMVGVFPYCNPPSSYEFNGFTMGSFYEIEKILQEDNVYKGFCALIFEAV